MKRVSMAFVGQVSAASSPAIAKLKGRARATNDPAYVPLASSHRAQSRRRRDLVAIFLDALGGRAAVSELQLVQVRKAAELTTAAEAVRARVLAGDAGWTLSCSSRSRAKQGARFERSTSRPPPSAARPSLKWEPALPRRRPLGGPGSYTSGTLVPTLKTLKTRF